MSLELPRARPGAFPALLLGTALGMLALAAGASIAPRAMRPLAATGAVAATLLVSLLAGVWAGAVPRADGARPARKRWLSASAMLVLAAVVAVLWMRGAAARLGVAAQAVALLGMVGMPGYGLGMLLPPLGAEAREAAGDEGEDDDVPETAGEAQVRLAGWGVAGVALGALVAGALLLPSVPAPTVLVIAALLVVAPFYLRARPHTAWREETLFETETPFGSLRVAEMCFDGRRQPERRLYQNGEMESGELARTGAPTFAYIAAAERWFAEVARVGESFLFLGGGAYTLPRRIAERDARARITVVELDPEVTRVAEVYFGLRPQYGITTLHGDARRVADTLPDASFDRIFVDVYEGSEMVPLSLVTREALRALRRLLRPGGTVLMNVIGVASGAGERRLWATVRTFASVFPGARLYLHLERDDPERQNFLLAGAPDGAPLPATAGAFALWPEAEWPAVDVPVLSDFAAPLAPAPRARGADSAAQRV